MISTVVISATVRVFCLNYQWFHNIHYNILADDDYLFNLFSGQPTEWIFTWSVSYWYSITLIDYITDDYITVANLIANFLMHGYKTL